MRCIHGPFACLLGLSGQRRARGGEKEAEMHEISISAPKTPRAQAETSQNDVSAAKVAHALVILQSMNLTTNWVNYILHFHTILVHSKIIPALNKRIPTILKANVLLLYVLNLEYFSVLLMCHEQCLSFFVGVVRIEESGDDRNEE